MPRNIGEPVRRISHPGSRNRPASSYGIRSGISSSGFTPSSQRSSGTGFGSGTGAGPGSIVDESSTPVVRHRTMSRGISTPNKRTSENFMNTLMTMEQIDEVDKMIKTRREFLTKQAADHKKLRRMVHEVPNLVDLMDNCSICMDPFLKDIGKETFGVISYSCCCSIVRTIHMKCCMSSDGEVPKCAYCRTPIILIVPTLVGRQTMNKRIRVQRTSAVMSSSSSRDDDVPNLQSDTGSEDESDSEDLLEPTIEVLDDPIMDPPAQEEIVIDESFLGLDD